MAPKWSIPLVEVLEELAIWERGVYLQRHRILESDETGISRRADAQLLALALRQVLRLAECCRAVAPHNTWSTIDLALKRFKDTSPDVKDLRDVLDHMDAYLRGVGDEFPAGPPNQVYPHGLLIFIPTISWEEPMVDTFRLNLVPAPGRRPLVLDVSRDSEAAIALCDAIRDAVR